MSIKCGFLNTSMLLASLLGASSVLAHAHLEKEAPAADSSVSPPSELRLMFSEGIEPRFTKVKITTSAGAEVAISGIATNPGDNKELIVTPAKPLAAGEYNVEWHAVSVDTHKSEGHYRFKVNP
ncbi:copper homeostasis periplasmic binding protein CopC [Pseudomonas sp. PDM22]|uniref:copper homeostasis periplasmic binding protein CopC n=1 Tax=Pseudomonas sp. PDM22 TaxID=2769287 RepID=UPI00177D1152|nr:copper homeostasis periplasmic binding protein CopC [Pseudomonas sp. PDM22]MBD9513659.1 copper homeostasis periplasmic binding protein CopC [Pseudomonas sp. PDM22]